MRPPEQGFGAHHERRDTQCGWFDAYTPMNVRTRSRRRRRARAGGSRISTLMLMLGVLVSSVGVFLATTAAPVEAATAMCGTRPSPTPLMPGASGSCTVTFSESAKQAQHQRFTVTVDVDAIANSSVATGNTGSEAPLDGRPTGLKVTVSDSARNTFGIGQPSCTGSYPHATPCSSADHRQAVRAAVDITSWSDSFTLGWSLPRDAGNPYQGGSATITLTAHFNGVSGTSPTGGVLAASAPSTGIGSILTAGLALIAAGIGLMLLALTRLLRSPRRSGR